MKKLFSLMLIALLVLVVIPMAFATSVSVKDSSGNEIHDGDKIGVIRVYLTITTEGNEGFLVYGVDTLLPSISTTKYTKLCGVKCGENKNYTRIISLKEGDNFISVIDSEGPVVDYQLFVDTKAPRILQVSPKREGLYTNDQFNISLIEKNKRFATLYYRLSSSSTFLNTELNCVSQAGNSEKLECSGSTSLEGEIYYYFEVKDDIDTHTKNTSIMKITLDKTPPTVTILSPEDTVTVNKGDAVKLTIGSSELSKISYQLDYSGPMLKMCNGCTYAEKSIRLSSKGNHVITAKATDIAGNEGTTQQVLINVV